MDQSPLTSTFIRFRDRLRRMAAGIVGDDMAEDAMHDAFCKLWNNRKVHIVGESEALRISITAVRNSAIDTVRHTSFRNTVRIDDMENQSDTCATEEDQEAIDYDTVVNLACRILDGKQYEVFRLHDIEGLGYDETASRLDIRPEYVRVTLSRARKKIREYFRNHNMESL